MTMSPRARQGGVVVIMAILIMALATTVSAFAAWRQQLWIRQAETMTERNQADAIAKAGLDFARRVLVEMAKKYQDVTSLDQEWATRSAPPLPVENGYVKGVLDDAQGLYNLNNLVDASGTVNPDQVAVLGRLMTSLKLSPELVNAVVDWIDPDTTVTYPGGAEDMDYLGMKDPYRAANRPLQDVDELIRVKGFTADIINTLRPFVTALPNAQPTPLNVNTTRPEILAALLNIDASDAKAILEKAPFKDEPAFLLAAKGAYDNSKRQPAPLSWNLHYGNLSSYFIASVRAQFGRTQTAYTALLYRQGPAWPRLMWQKQTMN
jgi:general secretion pathway protein K